MNLVGFGLTAHDSSIAAYKDGKFLYRKAERQFNQKHAHAGMDWALSVLKEWDIQEYESAESTWLSGKNPQKIKDGNKLDHHYSHLLSSSKKQECNLVLDSLVQKIQQLILQKVQGVVSVFPSGRTPLFE